MSLLPGSADEDAARQAIVELCAAGPFDRDDADRALAEAGLSVATDDVLERLAERQTIVRLGGDPPRWELVID